MVEVYYGEVIKWYVIYELLKCCLDFGKIVIVI